MIALGLVAVAVLGMTALSASFQKLRVSGASTPNTGAFYFVCDSSDTFQVDTAYSDTVAIGDYKWLYYNLHMTGYTLADSANDSVLVIIKGYGTYDGSMSTVILTDTIPTTLGTLDSTAVISGTIKIDSLGFNKLYFETVFKDSFIMGAGVDTTTIRLKYNVLQSEYVLK